MRMLLAIVVLLLVPIGVHAQGFATSNVVTGSVVGTVPLASGDLMINDAFWLTGAGSALLFRNPPPAFVMSHAEAFFDVSGGGLSASGGVINEETRAFFFASARLDLVTPLYHLDFSSEFPEFPDSAHIGGVGNHVFFSVTQSHNVHVQVGEESGTLLGTVSFEGTAVPEPSRAILLTVGAAGIALMVVCRPHFHTLGSCPRAVRVAAVAPPGGTP